MTEKSETYGMSISQRILHVGGRNNAAGYVEFGSTQAVEALVRQVLRDYPEGCPGIKPAFNREDSKQEPLYYLQDARWGGVIGNCLTFWRKGGGYTTNLDKAARFTLEAAMNQHKCRETDLPWLCTEVDKLRRPTVDCQYMPRSWQAQAETLNKLWSTK